MIDVIKSALYV